MDKSFNDELFSLLESKRDFADVDECIKLMGEEGTRYHGSALVPLREAINIYQTRSRINSELKNEKPTLVENVSLRLLVSHWKAIERNIKAKAV